MKGTLILTVVAITAAMATGCATGPGIRTGIVSNPNDYSVDVMIDAEKETIPARTPDVTMRAAANTEAHVVIKTTKGGITIFNGYWLVPDTPRGKNHTLPGGGVRQTDWEFRVPFAPDPWKK